MKAAEDIKDYETAAFSLLGGEGLNHSSWMRRLGFDPDKDRKRTKPDYDKVFDLAKKATFIRKQGSDWFRYDPVKSALNSPSEDTDSAASGAVTVKNIDAEDTALTEESLLETKEILASEADMTGKEDIPPLTEQSLEEAIEKISDARKMSQGAEPFNTLDARYLPPKPFCLFCGVENTGDNLKKIGDQFICESCTSDLRKIIHGID